MPSTGSQMTSPPPPIPCTHTHPHFTEASVKVICLESEAVKAYGIGVRLFTMYELEMDTRGKKFYLSAGLTERIIQYTPVSHADYG